MVCIRDGASVSRKDRSRPILTLEKGSCGSENTHQLGGIEQNDNSLFADSLQRFEAALWAARNDWSIRKAKSGLFGSARLTKQDAERAWKRQFAGAGAK